MPERVMGHVHPNLTPARARWSSTIALGLVLSAALGMMPVARLRAQAGSSAPTAAQLDSIKQRLEDAEAALQALREQLAAESQTALRTRSRASLEFRGLAVMHAFSNSARTNNVDLPGVARPDSGTGPQGGLGMSIRQTRLGLAMNVSEVAGGSFRGDIDVDFYGGQFPSPGGRTFPLVRLRTASGTLSWERGSIMIGQEQPLIADLDPVSLATIGVPGFGAAGNLWLWLPQVRGAVHSTGRVRFGAEVAVLAPTSGEANTSFDTQFDAAERTGTPYLEGLLRLDWGDDDRPAGVALGYHTGKVADASDVERKSNAIAAMVRVPFGSRLELRGEAFDGQALRGLGGGGIAQGIGAGGAPVRTRGGWAQLNLKATPRVLIGAGSGYDDPQNADLPVTARLRNQTTEAHLHWRPTGPIVVGFEWRRTQTTYTAGTSTNQHLNLAFGFEF